MNPLYIREIRISWDGIDRESYLRSIEAIHNVDHIRLTNPVTFFVGDYDKRAEEREKKAEAAREAAESAKEAAREAAETAKDTAKAAADKAKGLFKKFF